MKIELPTIECQRCHHKWTPRSSEVNECPACQSTKFYRAPTKKELDRKRRREEKAAKSGPEPTA